MSAPAPRGSLITLLLTPEQANRLLDFLEDEMHAASESGHYKECLLCQVAAKLDEHLEPR